jgi:hypothetical protein
VEPAVVDQLLTPERFFVPPPGRVRIDRSPGAWNVFLHDADYPSDWPLIEIREAQHFEVTRNIRMRSGEWLSEQVGTAPLDRPEMLRRCIGFALSGTSRLAITSIETPHPAYALGLIAYPLDRSGELEAKLRAGVAIDDPGDDFPALFNRLALSPWTALADNLIAAVLRFDHAAERLGFMLRHLARHLNAFDLVRFHNRGANYPDALMLDALLRAFIPLLRGDEDHIVRRALRQGWLARKRCEGLYVPDRPTSPGDNARALPFAAVPDHQLSEPHARKKQLFLDQPADALLTPIARSLLNKSIEDLSRDQELRELGTALFLDRPLGAMGKRSGEADRTTLLSYEACSVRLIRTRLDELGITPPATIANPTGYPVARLIGHPRESVVALEDAKKVALDFVFTRTTRSSLVDWLRDYDFEPLNAIALDAYHQLTAERGILIRTGPRRMIWFDAGMRAAIELSLDDSARYVECGGVEYVEGLCAIVDGRSVSLSPRC